MSNQEIKSIRNFLSHEGFSNQELIDDLIDHLATEIEFSMDSEKLDFQTSFEKAKQKLLPNSPYQLERDLKILTTPKHNIMIKKVAFIGGYLSALCLCISILFTVKAYQDTYKAEKQREAVQMAAGLTKYSTDEQRDILTNYHIEAADLKLKSIEFFSTSQALLVVSICLFALTYLPYRFYNSYQKSQLELTA